MVWLGMFLIVVGFALVVPRGAQACGDAPRHTFLHGNVVTTSGYEEPSPAGFAKVRVAGFLMVAVGFAVLFAAA